MKEIVIVQDTREQTPFVFPEGVSVIEGTLQSGDYSIQGMTDLVAVERKSLQDMVGCCGKGRDRFKRELHRLRGYRAKAIIIESTLQKLTNGNWRGKMTSNQVLGAIASWRQKFGVDFIYAGNAELGAQECFRYLKAFHGWMYEFTKRFN
jgi:DNA excision repair protein ERCC-4